MSNLSLCAIQLNKSNKHATSGVATTGDQWVILTQQDAQTPSNENLYTLSIFSSEAEAKQAEKEFKASADAASTAYSEFRVSSLPTPPTGITSTIVDLKRQQLHHFTSSWQHFFEAADDSVGKKVKLQVAVGTGITASLSVVEATIKPAPSPDATTHYLLTSFS